MILNVGQPSVAVSLFLAIQLFLNCPITENTSPTDGKSMKTFFKPKGSAAAKEDGKGQNAVVESPHPMKGCNIETCLNRCTKANVICDEQKDMCVCKGKSEEAADNSLVNCTEIGKIYKKSCRSIKTSGEVVNIYYNSHTETLETNLEVKKCQQKCTETVKTFVQFCYKAKSFLCQMETEEKGPKCFCYLYS